MTHPAVLLMSHPALQLLLLLLLPLHSHCVLLETLAVAAETLNVVTAVVAAAVALVSSAVVLDGAAVVACVGPCISNTNRHAHQLSTPLNKCISFTRVEQRPEL